MSLFLWFTLDCLLRSSGCWKARAHGDPLGSDGSPEETPGGGDKQMFGSRLSRTPLARLEEKHRKVPQARRSGRCNLERFPHWFGCQYTPISCAAAMEFSICLRLLFHWCPAPSSACKHSPRQLKDPQSDALQSGKSFLPSLDSSPSCLELAREGPSLSVASLPR